MPLRPYYKDKDKMKKPTDILEKEINDWWEHHCRKWLDGIEIEGNNLRFKSVSSTTT